VLYAPFKTESFFTPSGVLSVSITYYFLCRRHERLGRKGKTFMRLFRQRIFQHFSISALILSALLTQTVSAAILSELVAGIASLPGYTGDGGSALSAQMSVTGMATDQQNNIYFTDLSNSVVRKIDAASGIITTIAGSSGSTGFSGDGGLAILSALNTPDHIAVDNAGKVYVSDINPTTNTHVLRIIDQSSGLISSITTTSTSTIYGMAYNPVDNTLYFTIFDPNIGDCISSASLNTPITALPTTCLASSAPPSIYHAHITFDDLGNLYYQSDSVNGVVHFSSHIRKRELATGLNTHFAGTGVIYDSLNNGFGGPAINATLPPNSGMKFYNGILYLLNSNGSLSEIDTTSGIVTLSSGLTGNTDCNAPALGWSGSASNNTTSNFYASLGNDRICHYIIDNQIPIVNLTAPSIINTLTVPLTLTCRDKTGCSRMRFQIDAEVLGPWFPYSNTYDAVFSGDGNHTVKVQVEDGAGNGTGFISASLLIDRIPPSAPIITTPATDIFSQQGTQTISGSAEANGTLLCQEGVNDIALVNVDPQGLWSFFFTLSEGKHLITAKAQDAAGNWSPVSSPVNITIDTTPPVITVPADLEITITGTNIAASDVVVSGFLSGATANDNIDGSITNITHNAPASFPIGVTTVTFSATDSSGNTATATAQFTLTRDRPPVITVPVDLELTITGTNLAVSNSDISAFLSGATANDDIDGSITNITHDAPALFPIGVTTVTFSATDNSGNTATATATITLLGQLSGTASLPPSSSTNTLVVTPITTPNTTTSSSVTLASAVTVNPVTGTPPADVTIPFGVIDYSVNVANKGDSVTISISLPTALPTNMVLYKVDNNGVYTLIPDNLWTLSTDNTFELQLTDGGPFDLDGIANGIIVDPIAIGEPKVTPPSTTSTTSSSGSSSGGGSLNLFWLISLMFSGLFLRRRRA